ncbi:carboxymuconolactone decarboxylase family protein [Krasilnikovia sp. MM14-A1004]|uniref:carboxymuconolactone decarboxylase family protein n=1 Tax=Krasilnikovia sp. MM14-A1004 TaxID=3373541 RepID=UPI00399CC409
MTAQPQLQELLHDLTQGSGPVLETVARMNADTMLQGGLDERTAIMSRFAALIALDASPASYLVHLGVADQMGIAPEDIRAVLIELAPVVGSARIVSAAANIERAIQLASG